MNVSERSCLKDSKLGRTFMNLDEQELTKLVALANKCHALVTRWLREAFKTDRAQHIVLCPFFTRDHALYVTAALSYRYRT